MNSSSIAALALLVTLLAPPWAQAAELHGDLWFDAPANATGPTRIESSAGILRLDEVVRTGEPAVLSWSRASGGATVARGQDVDGVTTDPGWEQEPLDLPAGSLLDLTCPSPCIILLQAEGRGIVAMSGNATGNALSEQRGAEDILVGQGTPVQLALALPARRYVETRASGALAVGDRRPTISGDVTLHMWGASGVFHGADGSRLELWSGRRDTPILPPFGRVTDYELRRIDLLLENATLAAPPGAPATLLSSDLRMDVEGGLAGQRASGWASEGARRVDLHEDDVRFEGVLHARIAPALPLDGPPGELALRERDRGAVDGDGHLFVAGLAVRSGADAPAILVVASVAVGIIALVAIAKVGGGVWLYTRLTRGRLLENDRRRAVYDMVRARPGVHVAELSRELHVGRVVLQHHLRMLEVHQLIVPHPKGRIVAYFVPGAVPGAGTLAATMALKDETRRIVWRAASCRDGGATQAEICEETELSQRLVAYHLAKLGAVGLVVSDEARPQRYRAAEEARGVPSPPSGPPQ